MKTEDQYQDEQDQSVAFAGICFIMMAIFTIFAIIYGLVRSSL